MIIAAQNKNDEERRYSSSGGVFPLIARKIINDGGIVYGVAFNDDFAIEHVGIEKVDSIHRLCGSKYAFSKCNIFPDIKRNLDDNRLVLFTGTPCQTAALRSYLKRDYDNLYILDNICHGTPYNDLWNGYLKERSNGKRIQSISFRDKSNGWQHYRFVIKYTDGSEYNVDHDKDLYMRGFIDNLTIREVCFQCPFKGINNRKSDITLGDFWGVWDMTPEMFDDKGTSLLFINSQKGEKILSSVKDFLICFNVDEKRAISYNPSAINVSKPNIFYNKFWKEYKKTGRLISALKKYAEPGFMLKVDRKIHKVLTRDK